MKKIFPVLLAVILAFSLIFAVGCVHTIGDEGYKLIRIHIRAESNNAADQAVKLKVRDAISQEMTAKLKDVNSFETAYKRLEKMLDSLKKLADKTLKDNGFSYESRVRLNNEYFPTRTYEGIVVDSGYYDALIVELGSGKGDNWWCVIYPPLCYLEAEAGNKVEYKSLIKELWEKFIGTFRK